MQDKYVAQMRISRKIHQIEDDLDALLAAAGELISEVTTFRVNQDLDANVGHRAISRIIGAQASIVEARTKAIGAHSDMKKIMEERADLPMTCPDKTMGFLDDASAA